MSVRRPVYILSALLLLNIFVWVAVWQLSGPGLEVSFFDVGQGDAIFVEAPGGYQILIDGGPSSVILEKLGKEMPFWDRTLDFVILTHPDYDHVSGLIEVLKSYKVENILWSGVVRDTPEYREWENLIKNEGANIYIAKAGQRITAGSTVIDVLYPLESLEGVESSNANNTSVVTRLSYSDNAFLLQGDAYKSTEAKIMESGGIDSDVLKVGHHGSKTSTSKEFVDAVSPDIAVISCGKDNPYGHPHEETLQNLFGAEVLRTDLMGDIKISSDGNSLTLE